MSSARMSATQSGLCQDSNQFNKDPSFPRKRESRNRLSKCGALVKAPALYILTSQRNGTLYTGVTSDLVKRIWEHKNDRVPGFTKQHQIHQLVYFEQHSTMDNAIAREKQIKKWRRQWKLQLIEEQNPEWNDLYEALL